MDDSEGIKLLTLEWTRAQPAVGRFIRSFVRDSSDAEDVLQGVALNIVDRFDKYDRSRPFIGWALGVAKNLIKAHFRKQLKRPATAHEDTAVDRVADAFEVLQPELEDMKEALAECIQAVPSAKRQMLAWQYEDDLQPADIAQRVGKSANHVAVLLHRLRAGLRQCVERKMSGPVEAS
jgi:RNA polymerase sigma-70 factor (ECF subfamily)